MPLVELPDGLEETMGRPLESPNPLWPVGELFVFTTLARTRKLFGFPGSEKMRSTNSPRGGYRGEATYIPFRFTSST